MSLPPEFLNFDEIEGEEGESKISREMKSHLFRPNNNEII